MQGALHMLTGSLECWVFATSSGVISILTLATILATSLRSHAGPLSTPRVLRQHT